MTSTTAAGTGPNNHQAAPSHAETADAELAPIVEVRQVSRLFGKAPGPAGRMLGRLGLAALPSLVHAVDRVDLAIAKGTVLGLVGESGCGKSTLGRMIAGILPPTTGDIFWRGRNISTLSAAERRAGKLSTQMVFQNPFASLNPRMRVAQIVGEAPRVHGLIPNNGSGDEPAYVDTQLRRAGLDPALKDRYAHQLSGGQRQRIAIARALAVQPDMLICDEAVAALDVSIQAQIINLFMDLRTELDLTYLFISHDLGVVRHLSDRVAIMYLGRIVEEAPAKEIFSRANHPYTQLLLEEMPRIDTGNREFPMLKGELPSPLDPPTGCHFHPRCPHAFARCRSEAPELRAIATEHRSACHLNDAN